MPVDDSLGTCDVCDTTFSYQLIHNGFNDSAYAYCANCGMTALLSSWADNIPIAAGFRPHQRITESVQPFLTPCACGGRFTVTAAPRCPKCRSELSAERATEFIERNASGTNVGWHWQRTWSGMYAIVINGSQVSDNWVHRAASDPSKSQSEDR